MRHVITMLFLLKAVFSFAQNSNIQDSIPQPVYDTINIEIQSTTSFYFCSNLYALPRNCDTNDQSNCCSYSAQIGKLEKSNRSEQLSCYDGTSLNWTIFKTEEMAKQNFESYPMQIKQQMKSFKQNDISLFICGKKASACKLTYTTFQEYSLSEILFYITINGQGLFGHLYLPKNEKSSTELTQFFQQFVRF